MPLTYIGRDRADWWCCNAPIMVGTQAEFIYHEEWTQLLGYLFISVFHNPQSRKISVGVWLGSGIWCVLWPLSLSPYSVISLAGSVWMVCFILKSMCGKLITEQHLPLTCKSDREEYLAEFALGDSRLVCGVVAFCLGWLLPVYCLCYAEIYPSIPFSKV